MHRSGPTPLETPGWSGKPPIIMNIPQEKKQKKKQPGVVGWMAGKPARSSGENPDVLK